jgi:hypothetical protein
MRALELKGVRVVHAGDVEPKSVEIVSSEDLARSPLFVDSESRAVIESQVDFDKQKLVVFSWSGSGQDKLAGAGEQR